ncbi:MAG: hypothetical protein C0478_18010, partial [Planctomyces sp.]|nr:hypothetical protein [Planctomyces sp.]
GISPSPLLIYQLHFSPAYMNRRRAQVTGLLATCAADREGFVVRDLLLSGSLRVSSEAGSKFQGTRGLLSLAHRIEIGVSQRPTFNMTLDRIQHQIQRHVTQKRDESQKG